MIIIDLKQKDPNNFHSTSKIYRDEELRKNILKYTRLEEEMKIKQQPKKI
jgi:hypothetical protein